MNPQFIFLSLSVTGAVIVTVLLLLVAGVIGYLTAWFYAKSVYTPIIKDLEEENAELAREVSGLKDNISQLNGKISKIEEELAKKDKEIKGLKNPSKKN